MLNHRVGRVVTLGITATLLSVVAPSSASAASPTLTYVRSISTSPFVGTSVAMHDNEGLAYVEPDDRLWMVDDSTDQAYSVDRTTGRLGQVITRAELRAAVRFGRTELAGSSRSGDLEGITYVPETDQLYIFSGTCCISGVRPTVFRLSRPRIGAPFVVDSWQPLRSPYNDLSGVGTRNGAIWAGHHQTLVRYDYVTNSTSSARVLPGVESIYGVGFNASGTEMWIADKGNRLKKYDFATSQPISGYNFSMSSRKTRDARAVEVVGDELFVSDGYDYYSSSSIRWAVRVYRLG